MDDLIEALTIFKKYQKPTNNPTNCSHDELAIMGANRMDMSLIDIKRVGELGFVWSETEEYWFSYRFGSA